MQNIKLSFKGVQDATINKPLTTYNVEKMELKEEQDKDMEEGQISYVVTIPDMYCEEERCILTSVALPACPSLSEPASIPIVTCHVEYFNISSSRQTMQDAWFNIVRNKKLDQPIPSDNRDEIELHQLRCGVATTLDKANALAHGGDMAAARRLVDENQQMLMRNRMMPTSRLVSHLVKTTQESLNGLDDEVEKGNGRVLGVQSESTMHSVCVRLQGGAFYFLTFSECSGPPCDMLHLSCCASSMLHLSCCTSSMHASCIERVCHTSCHSLFQSITASH